MEKLSSILPSTARVTSVDLDEAPPTRPGAPAFGRRQGRNTISDRITLSKKAKEMAAKETMLGRDPKEISRAKMVDEVNRKFFETRLKPPVEKEVPHSEDVTNELAEAPETADLKEEAVNQYEPKAPSAPRLSIEA